MTIKDIARETSVSIKTVSRVVNNLPYVNEETRARVWKAIEKLGYCPSEDGRRLALLRNNTNLVTGNIGCVLFRNYSKYRDLYIAELLGEIERILQEANLRLHFTANANDLQRRDRFIRLINPTSVDGCILFLSEMQRKEISAIRARIQNLVVFPEYLNDPDISCVSCDGVQAGFLATRHLISLGHRRIACVVGQFDRPESTQSQQRLKGYKQALAEAGYGFSEKLVAEGCYTFAGAVKATDALLDTRPMPSALFSVSDPMAIGVYKAILRRGLKIPDDVSVVGCDNIEIAAQLHPALTTVDFNKSEMVKTAIKILQDNQQRGKSFVSTKVVYPPQLIEAESCRKI